MALTKHINGDKEKVMDKQISIEQISKFSEEYNKNRNNKIFIDELKRTFPIYILGIVFYAIVIYIV